MYDSLMFPFITIGPRRGDGMAGQDGWEGNRRTGGQEEKQEEKKRSGENNLREKKEKEWNKIKSSPSSSSSPTFLSLLSAIHMKRDFFFLFYNEPTLCGAKMEAMSY